MVAWPRRSQKGVLEYKSFRTSTELVAVGRELVTAQPDGLAGGLRMKQPRRESDDE